MLHITLKRFSVMVKTYFLALCLPLLFTLLSAVSTQCLHRSTFEQIVYAHPAPHAYKDQSNTAYPNTAHPNTAHPNTTHPNTAHPNTAHPNTAHPNKQEDISTWQWHTEIFSSYEYHKQNQQVWNDFTLNRAELGTHTPTNSRMGGEFRVEALRSAPQRSLMGLGGNQLILRLKRAWGFYTWHPSKAFKVRVQVGLQNDLWQEIMMWSFPLRSIRMSLGEDFQLHEVSDLGASIHFAWRTHLLSIALSNGEGHTMTEQNQGKNTFARLFLHLFNRKQHNLYWAHGYMDGSRGVASIPNHRFYNGLYWLHPRINAQINYIHAWGLVQRSTLNAHTWQFNLSAWLWKTHLGAFFTWDRIDAYMKHKSMIAMDTYTTYPNMNLSTTERNVTGMIDQAVDQPQRLAATSQDQKAHWISFGLIQTLYQSTPTNNVNTQTHHAHHRHHTPTQNGFTIRLIQRFEYQTADTLTTAVPGALSLGSRWLMGAYLAVSWGQFPPLSMHMVRAANRIW